MNEILRDTDSAAYSRGFTDGYDGNMPDEAEGANVDYQMGYADGQDQWVHECEQDREAYEAEQYYYSDVEMGMYDDDPNPYHGDYSEM